MSLSKEPRHLRARNETEKRVLNPRLKTTYTFNLFENTLIAYLAMF